MSNISIMIIEDEVLLAMDLQERVISMGYDVMTVRHSSNMAISFLKEHTPDLILCDINIKGEQDGIDVAAHVLAYIKVPLIFVTALSDRQTLERAKKALPYGYIVKPFTDGDILSAIEVALYKHSLEIEKHKITKEKLLLITGHELTDREHEMLIDIIDGKTNAQISEDRNISKSTVKYHITNLLEKMEVGNRAGVLHKIIKLLT